MSTSRMKLSFSQLLSLQLKPKYDYQTSSIKDGHPTSEGMYEVETLQLSLIFLEMKTY